MVRAPGVFEFTAAHQYRDDNPSGTSADLYIISVRVNDGTVDSNSLTTKLTVSNVAPAFAALSFSATTLIEGSPLSLNGTVNDVSSLDSHTVTVNWGDGTIPQNLTLSPAKAFSGSHVYSIPGTYTVVTSAQDDDGGVVLDVRFVTVEDLSPVITPANLGSVAAGSLFVRTGNFTDLTGPEDSWTAAVRYDNGPFLPLALNPDKSFYLQNVFATAGLHTVTVIVTDNFGCSDTATFSVNVQPVPPAPVVFGMQLNGGLTQRARFTGITLQFSQNVGASLTTADIVLRNQTTGTDVSPMSAR